MAFQKFVYLSELEYAQLVSSGTITKGSTTVTYNEDDVYFIPDESGNIYRHNIFLDCGSRDTSFCFTLYTSSPTAIVLSDLDSMIGQDSGKTIIGADAMYYDQTGPLGWMFKNGNNYCIHWTHDNTSTYTAAQISLTDYISKV